MFAIHTAAKNGEGQKFELSEVQIRGVKFGNLSN